MDLNQPFLINQRFLIDPSRHSVHDLQTQSETRLELRHVNLLAQLCSNKGKLLERDFLIKEIWNDYSGADEALTQGISLLRKILFDEKKELIKTIPKKGYILQAEISAPQPPSTVRGQPSRQKNTRIWFYSTLSAMVILAVLLIFLRPRGMQQKVKPANVGDEKFHYIPAPKPAPEEDKRDEKHTSPPPEGKDDARKAAISK